MTKLLLFDVDLTLIQTGGCGRRAMSLAFEEILGNGHTAMKNVSFAGNTDGGIFREALSQVEGEWNQQKQDEFKNSYLKHLVKEIIKPDKSQEIKPGILKLLPKLQERDDITLALLTGNWEQGARTKLQHFDLWHFFEFGAYADDAWVRNELPPIAAKRFSQIKGKPIQPKNVYVIGDTPKDVECTRPYGAKSVAVATGYFSVDQLKKTEPDYMFENFAEPEMFIEILD